MGAGIPAPWERECCHGPWEHVPCVPPDCSLLGTHIGVVEVGGQGALEPDDVYQLLSKCSSSSLGRVSAGWCTQTPWLRPGVALIWGGGVETTQTQRQWALRAFTGQLVALLRKVPAQFLQRGPPLPEPDPPAAPDGVPLGNQNRWGCGLAPGGGIVGCPAPQLMLHTGQDRATPGRAAAGLAGDGVLSGPRSVHL